MSYKSTYVSGDWLALCDVCGRKYKASKLKARWDGLMCCNADWEIRQPQDFVKAKADIVDTPWSRPEPEDEYLP